jgi:hypothetical protein
LVNNRHHSDIGLVILSLVFYKTYTSTGGVGG